MRGVALPYWRSRRSVYARRALAATLRPHAPPGDPAPCRVPCSRCRRAALAQSAGDEQYADPFGQVEEPNSGQARSQAPDQSAQAPATPAQTATRHHRRGPGRGLAGAGRRRCPGPASRPCSWPAPARSSSAPVPACAGASPEPHAGRDQRPRRRAGRDWRCRALELASSRSCSPRSVPTATPSSGRPARSRTGRATSGSSSCCPSGLAARGSSSRPRTSRRWPIQPTWCVIHDAAPFREPGWYGRAYGAWHRALIPRLARRAKLVIVPSEFVRSELIELFGLPADRVRAIPPGSTRASAPPATRPPCSPAWTWTAAPTCSRSAPRASARTCGCWTRSRRGSPRAASMSRWPAPGARTSPPPAPESPGGSGTWTTPTCPPSTPARPRSPCRRSTRASACRASRPWRQARPVVAADRAALPEACAGAALLADPDDEEAFAAALVEAVGTERHRLIDAGRSAGLGAHLAPNGRGDRRGARPAARLDLRALLAERLATRRSWCSPRSGGRCAGTRASAGWAVKTLSS